LRRFAVCCVAELDQLACETRPLALRGFPRPVPHTYPVEAYTRTTRIAAAELGDAPALGQHLLRHFFAATTEIEDFNPWTQPNNR
jgi:hypothetical protein